LQQTEKKENKEKRNANRNGGQAGRPLFALCVFVILCFFVIQGPWKGQKPHPRSIKTPRSKD